MAERNPHPLFFFLVAALALPLAVPVALAAEEEDEAAAPIEEVVVTGSRIKRSDFTSASPITVVTGQSLDAGSRGGFEKHVGEYRPLQHPRDAHSGGVGPQIIGNGKQRLDVGPVELVHGQYARAPELQAEPSVPC